MSIATEITRLQQAKADIKAALEEKGVTVGDGTIDTYATKVAEIESGGGSDCTRYMTTLYKMFHQVAFPDGYELDLTVKNSANASSGTADMMGFINQATGLKTVKLALIDKGTTVSANYAFAGTGSSSTLETVDISGMGCTFSSFAGTFQNQQAIKHVIGEIDLSASINNANAFYNCYLMEDVGFKAGSVTKAISFLNSPNLSDTSRQSITDGLADLTGSATQSITWHSNVIPKLTEEQLTAMANKNWTVS